MVTGDNLSAAGSFGAKSGLLSPTEDWPLKEFSYYGCDGKVFNKVSQVITKKQIFLYTKDNEECT